MGLEIPKRDLDKLDAGCRELDSRSPEILGTKGQWLDHEFEVFTLPNGERYARAATNERADIRVVWTSNPKMKGLPPLRLRKLETSAVGRILYQRGKLEAIVQAQKEAKLDVAALPVWAWHGRVDGKDVRGICAAKSKQDVARAGGVKYPYQLAVDYKMVETDDAEECRVARAKPGEIFFRGLNEPRVS